MNPATNNDTFSSVVIGLMGLVIFFLLYFFQSRNRTNDDDASKKTENENVQDANTIKESKPNGNSNAAGYKQRAAKAQKKDSKPVFSHEWLACTLKGHTASVQDIDFSPNGKYLLSCDDDRSCFLWIVRDWGSQSKSIGSMKIPLQLDHASRVAFSPDSKAFLLSLYNSRSIAVYKLARSTDADGQRKGIGLSAISATQFQHQAAADAAELLSMGMASTGNFIMTCYSDTNIKLWSRKGDLLTVIDTCHMNNCMAAVSPCGRFVASCGFTPDVKVWEVVFDKAGNYQSANRAFELKGHNAQVDCLAFSANSTRMATVSKDMTWKLWDIDVRYKLGEDPKLLVTGRYAKRNGIGKLALSPDARVVAIATGSSVSVYSCLDASRLAQFDSLHTGDVQCIQFDIKGQYLVTCGGDRHLPVIFNVPGATVQLQDCQAKIKSTQSRAQKDMFEQEVQAAKQFLSSHSLSPII